MTNQPAPNCVRSTVTSLVDAGERARRRCCSGRRRTACRRGSGRAPRPRTGSTCGSSSRSRCGRVPARCSPKNSRPLNLRNGLTTHACCALLMPGLDVARSTRCPSRCRRVLHHLVVARAAAVAGVQRLVVRRASARTTEPVRRTRTSLRDLPCRSRPCRGRRATRFSGTVTWPRVSPPRHAAHRHPRALAEVDLAADLGREGIHEQVADERVVHRVAVVGAAEVLVAVVDLEVAGADRHVLHERARARRRRSASRRSGGSRP